MSVGSLDRASEDVLLDGILKVVDVVDVVVEVMRLEWNFWCQYLDDGVLRSGSVSIIAAGKV